MKKVKILIAIIILMIFTLICLLVYLNNIKNNTNSENKSETFDIYELTEYNTKEVSLTYFYTVQKCISAYLDSINMNNSVYYGKDDNGNFVKVVKEEEIKDKIYNQLSKEYISKHNINSTNIYNFVDDITEKQIFNILKIGFVENENSDQYIVYGFLQNTKNEFTKYGNFIVNINKKDNVYSIEPINEIVKDVNKINVQDVAIEKNDDNTLPSVKIKPESTCREYFNLYKRIMLSKPEEAYELLNKEYKEKRFGNIDEFKKYVNNNKTELEKIVLDEYFVDGSGKNTEYVCKDTNNNLYIFNLDTVTDYDVKLDTYTLITDNFKNTYNKADEQGKAQMNVDKWIQMLNNRDYKTAYECLDQTFRENTFKNQEIFEKYMRAKYPLHYSIQYTDYEKNSNLEILTVVLTDITGENKNTSELKIVMKLQKNFEFSMSFEI